MRRQVATAKHEGIAPVAALPKRNFYLFRPAFYCAFAIVSCLFVSAAVRSVLTIVEPGKFPLLAKVAPAAADPDTNVVFFGTSRIELGIIPDVFDRAMRDSGLDGIRSYNLGDGGQSVLEVFLEAEALFKSKPHGIKFAFVEPDLTSQLVIREQDSLEAIQFFTAANAILGMGFMAYPFHSPPPEMPLPSYLANILHATMRHYLNIGLAIAPSEPPDTSISAGSRGYPDLDPRIWQLMTPTDDYVRQVAAIGTHPPDPQLISNRQLNVILEVISYIRSHGAIPILLRTPQLAHWEFANAVAAKYKQRCAGRSPPLFDFSSPIDYTQLYEPAHRMNEDHLNSAGAAIFSKLVAQRLARAIGDGSLAAPPCD
jgi:hypothetical protein